MSTLTVGTISEKVTDAGVAVDGVTLKDGGAVFTSAITATDNTVDLGASGTRFKDIYLSGGAFLGGTGSANKLEDYEEGTWTPTYIVDSGTNPTVTYNTASTTGVYAKVGSLVHLQARIRTNATSGGSGNLALGGLPFPNISSSNHFSTANIGYQANWLADNFPVGAYIPPNTSYILLLKGRSDDHRDGKGLIISPTSLRDGTNLNDLMISATYRTD